MVSTPFALYECKWIWVFLSFCLESKMTYSMASVGLSIGPKSCLKKVLETYRKAIFRNR